MPFLSPNQQQSNEQTAKIFTYVVENVYGKSGDTSKKFQVTERSKGAASEVNDFTGRGEFSFSLLLSRRQFTGPVNKRCG